MPARDLICPTCYFVTNLPPPICPFCGTEMMGADGEDVAASTCADLPWIEAWVATEDPELDEDTAQTATPAARATSAAP